MFTTIAWYLGVALISIGLLLLLSLLIFIETARYQAYKFMFELPWLKWLNLEDLPALGFSKVWARLILPIFHEMGNLEVLLIDEDGMDDADHERVDRWGFNTATVPLYEFKLTKRKGRKEKFSISLKNLVPALAPSHT